MGREEKVVSCCDIERKIRYDDTRFRSHLIYNGNLPFLEAIAKNPRVVSSELFKNNGTYVPDPYVFRVRCMGKLHKIIIWPDGAVTLTAHLGKVCKQRDEVYSWAGKDISCRDFLEHWISRCSRDSKGLTQVPAKRLADDVRGWRTNRKGMDGERWVSSRLKASFDPTRVSEKVLEDKLYSLRRRLDRHVSDRVRRSATKVFDREWTYNHNVSSKDGLGIFQNALRYQYSLSVSTDFDDWKKKLYGYGLLNKPLSILVTFPEDRPSYGPSPLAGMDGDRQLIVRYVLPIRLLDYYPFTLIGEPGNLLMEVIDKEGTLYTVEVHQESVPGKKKVWKVVEYWPSGTKLVSTKRTSH